MDELVRNILEIGIGVLYSLGALFNLLYTRNHGEGFFGSFAEGAIIVPMRGIISRVVIPNSRAFTMLLVGFQILVAVSIFSRGPLAVIGLYAGTAFCVLAAVASNLPGAVANLLLAAAQFALAYTR
jgi:hypothetical protein